jgi:rhodanese-related sulfurtransferase
VILPLSTVALLIFVFSFTAISEGGHDSSDFNTINVERVKFLLDAGEKILIIDLRPAAEFQEKRIPGARSIPVADLQKRIGEVPKTGRVIFYLGPSRNDTLDEAFRFLEDNGYRNAAMLVEGFQGWIRRGYPIENGRK